MHLPECSVDVTGKVNNSHPILIQNLTKIQNQTSRKKVQDAVCICASIHVEFRHITYFIRIKCGMWLL